MKTEHKLLSGNDRRDATIWFCAHRIGIEFRQRLSPAPCSAVHDSPCEAGNPSAVYQYKRPRESWLQSMLGDERRTFCLCGRTEYFEAPTSPQKPNKETAS